MASRQTAYQHRARLVGKCTLSHPGPGRDPVTDRTIAQRTMVHCERHWRDWTVRRRAAVEAR